MKKIGPNPNSIYPNENIKQICYIKNVIKNPNIKVGNYTYYDDVNGANHRMCSVRTYPFNNLEILCSLDIEKLKKYKAI